MTQNNSNNDNRKTKKISSKKKSVDEITRVVQQFSTSDKREILSQMKVLIKQNESLTKQLKDIITYNKIRYI